MIHDSDHQDRALGALIGLAIGDAPELLAMMESDLSARSVDKILSSGYVVHTLEAALWSIETTASFEEALIRAVNLGDDADTVGAVTGQLAGALYGLSEIPQRWRAELFNLNHLTDLSAQLYTALAPE